MDATAGSINTTDNHIDSTANASNDHNATFADWFSRPMRIRSTPWSENSHIGISFNPWVEYFSDPEVKNKIRGFGKMRCKLHVKVMVNASPFQYSLAMLSYRPMGSLTNTSFSGGETGIETSYNNGQLLIACSQRQSEMIMPQYSQGCEMIIPYIYYKDYIKLDEGLTDLDELGYCTLQSFVPLLNSSGTPSTLPITVTIYIWAEEMDLCAPSMALQSDEYEQRPVSVVASAVASVAGVLSYVPFFGPYARATQMLATSVGKFAHMFGYSAPQYIGPSMAMRLDNSYGLCNPNNSIQIDKLSLDPKNELSINPDVVGGPTVDELTISHMCARESYLTRFEWAATDSPDTQLFKMCVTPDLFNAGVFTTARGNIVTSVIGTPAWFATGFFRNWRGSMKIKLICACSQLHRGRVRVMYDPMSDNIVEPGYPNPTRRLIQEVWDLASSNTFEMTIPYMSDSTMLRNEHDAATGFGVTPTYGSTAYYNPKAHNGMLYIYVQNELTATAPTDVNIMLFVSYPDMIVSEPNLEEEAVWSPFALQSDDIAVENTVSSVEVDGGLVSPDIMSVVSGEVVPSLRVLFARSSFWQTIKCAMFPALGTRYDTANQNLRTSFVSLIRQLHIFPRMPSPFYMLPLTSSPTQCSSNMMPWQPYSVFVGSAAVAYGCDAPTVPFQLISTAFVGWRGSIVWRAYGFGNGNFQRVDATLSKTGASWESIRASDLPALAPFGNEAWNCLSGGQTIITTPSATGVLTTDTQFYDTTNTAVFSSARSQTQGGLVRFNNQSTMEAVCPHYDNKRMLPGSPLRYAELYTRGVNENRYCDNMCINTLLQNNRTDLNYTDRAQDTNPHYDLFVSAGPDFSCNVFVNVPLLQRYGQFGFYPPIKNSV